MHTHHRGILTRAQGKSGAGLPEDRRIPTGTISDGDTAPDRDDHLQTPPAKKKTYPRIWLDKTQPGSVWGNLYATDEAPPKDKVTTTKNNET